MEPPAWQQRYDAALSAPGAASADSARTPDAFDGAVAAFLHEVLATETTAAGLAAIGRQLVVPFQELTSRTGKMQRDEKLRVLQLQAVCRLLCCCDSAKMLPLDADSTRKASDREAKSKRKKKSKKGATPTMSLQEELRALLDRIALLLDAANPPSISEDEAEQSPFHSFLVDGLEQCLSRFVPELFKQLREVYEIEDSEPIDESPASSIIPKATAPTKPEVLEASASILTALKEERPLRKRPRTDKTPLSRASTFPKPPPMLLRSVDRSLLTPRSAAASSAPQLGRRAVSAPVGASALPGKPKPTGALKPAPSVASVKTAVVMRTPDRPQRLPRKQSRVLIESSPPLRNPFAAARARRASSSLPQ
ncbi:hypothetical protein P43SY_002257 [Pythium insidiosum]|uniref:Uncharacterized protein n=1 Tax=Pythium insidiosum TaxID=114742 RepID=A0AAD5Q7X8_PYTIN|nr:hypothetical protein P43SY_002257 [Pythium insidiosum]